jgi:Na+/proline symporter
MQSIPRKLALVGIALIALIGLIHAFEAPEYLGLKAYVGVLFILNAVGALVVAIGIWRGSRAAWALGVLVAAGAFAGYILARTTGLPGGFKETEWTPLGIASLVIEAAYCLVAARALSAAPERRTPAHRTTSRPIGVS